MTKAEYIKRSTKKEQEYEEAYELKMEEKYRERESERGREERKEKPNKWKTKREREREYECDVIRSYCDIDQWITKQWLLLESFQRKGKSLWFPISLSLSLSLYHSLTHRHTHRLSLPLSLSYSNSHLPFLHVPSPTLIICVHLGVWQLEPCRLVAYTFFW